MVRAGASAKKRSAPSSRGGNTSKRARTTGTGVAGGGESTKLKFKSPAEFFAENKNIAGFDNEGKSLYTTVRELVENGLDAAEAMGKLPAISVEITRISKDAFRKMVGADARSRIDQSIYKDVESDKERKARETKEAREAKKRAKNTQSQEVPSQPTVKRAGGVETFQITVRDNGTGMPHDDVPNMLGRVLAGTKYCVRQSRGKFGLGSKMALIWSKMSTGLPVQVTTAKKGSKITECILDIDIAKNIPNVIKHVQIPNPQKWHGSKVSVTIAGNWTTYRAKILSYMRQMAVITPYAQFTLKFNADPEMDSIGKKSAKDLDLVFKRRTDRMPPPPEEVKHHPSSVNQLLLKQLIAQVEPETALVDFLNKQFVCISRVYATRLIKELGEDFKPNMPVGSLSLNHIRTLDSLLHEARFDSASGDCLSPAGEYNLRLGIMKEMRPKMVATHAEAADVFEGHPFIVECGVALGCQNMKSGVNVFRFANRIPLLFEAGNDVVSRTAKEDIKWNNYKIPVTTECVGVICSIVSTRIPFKGTGKEYIGDDSATIKAAVKRAITQCCLQLKTKITQRNAAKTAVERKKTILRYAPDVAKAIHALFEEVENPEPETQDIADQVKQGELTQDMLLKKLVEHVETIDKAQALEYVASTGRDSKTLQTVFLAQRSPGMKVIGVNVPPVNAKSAATSKVEPAVRFALLDCAQATV